MDALLAQWLAPLCMLFSAAVPWVAPPFAAVDGATAYSRGLSKAALKNLHLLAASLLALSSLCSAIALFSVSGTPADALYLAASAVTAGFLAGCGLQGTPSSDAIPHLLALALALQAYAFAALPGDAGTPARNGMSVTLALSASVGLGMVLLGARAAPAPSPAALNPYDSAPLLSRLTFYWVSPLMLLGATRPLVAEDLSPPPTEIMCAQVSRRLRAAAAGLPARATFLALLLRAWTPLFVAQTAFKLCFDTVQIAGPLLLARLIAWLEATASASAASPAPPQATGLALVGLFLASSGLQTLLLHQYFTRSFRLGMLLRTSTVLCVVDKSLRLSAHQGTPEEGSAGAAGAAAGAPAPAAAPSGAAGGPTAVISTIASDAKRLQDVSTYLSSIISAPFQIFFYSFFLYQQIGWSVLAGIAVMVASLPLNGYLASWGEKLQVKMMAARDARVAATGEALGAIRLIKANAWEEPFLQGIHALRAAELQHLHVYRLVSGIGEVTWLGIPVLVAVSSFSAFALLGGTLSPSIVFTCLSLFNLLRFPLSMLPSLISTLIEASVSVRRVEAFLQASEVQPGAVTRGPGVGQQGGSEGCSRGSEGDAVVLSLGTGSAALSPAAAAAAAAAAIELPALPSTAAMEFSAAHFSWQAPRPATLGPPGALHPTFTLGPLTLTLPRQALIAIVGASGSGKTALVNAVLGELHRSQGWLQVHGEERFFYAPQTPFILNASLQDNITFNLPLHEPAFATALQQACLGPDLALMPSGRLSEIGERGINLSGGQKARVGLARAFYAAAHAQATQASPQACPITLVLDDPLSAVDAHVSASLFRSLSQELRGATRLLVTHNLAVVERCDYVLVLGGGRVLQHGTPQQCLQEECGALRGMLESYNSTTRELTEAWDGRDAAAGGPLCAAAVEAPIGEGGEAGGMSAEAEGDALAGTPLPAQSDAPTPTPTPTPTPAPAATPRPMPTPTLTPGRLMQTEALLRGTVASSVAQRYLEAAGGILPLLHILLTFSSFYAAYIGGVFWLSYWAASTHTSSAAGPLPVAVGLGVYAALSLASILVLFLQLWLWVRTSLRAAAALHTSLLSKLLCLPSSFYDTTPSGRILSRISSDIAAIDGPLPDALHGFFSTAFNVLACLLTAVIAIPWFTLALPPLAYFYRALQRYYVATSRELQRLESISRSPLFSHLTETLTGIASVRAYACGALAASKAARLLDCNWRAYFSNVAANRWLAVRVETVSSCLTAGAALTAVLMAPTGGPQFASSAGLAVSTVLGVSQYCA